MPAQKLDGRQLAKSVREETKEHVKQLDYQPGLGAILVGDDPASEVYLRLKAKACAQAGLSFRQVSLPAEASEAEVLAAVERFNEDPAIDAFIVQLPLPDDLDENNVIAAIRPDKDADGFHPDNLKALLNGAPRIEPVLSQAVRRLIEATGLPHEKSAGGEPGCCRALVISNSRVFYEPLGRMLRDLGAATDWAAPDDPELDRKLKEAEGVIVAVGRPGFITGPMLQPGALVVDIGINRLPDGSLVGDVEAESAAQVAGWLTPVPGGVGPVTVACLLANTVQLAEQHRRP
jgi:methylenetetrahydrofolate dehydrogenase (NADP+)/methenyltetrahydrofolate cyclohydrolase